MLKNACFDNILDNRKLRRWKNRTYAEAVSSTKNIYSEPVKDVQKIGKSTLGTTDHQVVRNDSIQEASVSPNEHRNRLDTFMNQKKNVTTTDNRLSGYFCSETIFS